MKLQLTAFSLCLIALLLPLDSYSQRYLEMIEAGNYPLNEIRDSAESYFAVVGTGRGTGYKQFKRWEYVASMELDSEGVKIADKKLARQARDNRRTARMKGDQTLSVSGDWRELGPTYKNGTSGWNPGVGRITGIGIDPSNSNHIIVGGPTGGVWKTTNGGSTWLPLSDDFSTMDVYAMAISPHNPSTYYWGSTGGDIYVSTNAGASWTYQASPGSGNINKFLFHPTDPNIIFAVNESSGLYRTTNGGGTWSAVQTGYRGYDVEFKPGNTNVVYFSGTRVFKSTNGGASFTELTGFGTATNNYKMMGGCDANPELLCVVDAEGGKFGGFYKSTNSGVSFSKIHDGTVNFFGYDAAGADTKGQAPRDMDITINPADANEIHIAGIQTWRSLDGGNTFNLSSYWTPGGASSRGVGYCHADVDVLLYVGGTLYAGTDGGIYTSTNKGVSFTDISTGLGIRQFYKIGVSKTDPNVVSGGAQDNGTSVMYGTGRDWRCWLGADGMESFVDWNNPSRLFGTSQNGSFYRSTNQGVSYSGLGKPSSGSGAWVTPFEQDPSVANTLYCAYDDVWKSTDAGSNWTQISFFGSTSSMSNLKIAPSNNQYIYASRSTTLYVSTNGGSSWSTYNSAAGGNSIKYITVHPSNPSRVTLVAGSSVYESTNAGASFSNITNGLSGTLYCATYEEVAGKTGIYVGGYGTLYYTNSDLTAWQPYMTGLPNVRVYELEINYVSKTIFAGTYGRGLWESDLYSAASVNAPVAAFSADKTTGCEGVSIQFTDESTKTPTAWTWTFSGGTPSSSTLQNPTVVYSSAGVYDVVLQVSNNDGSDTETKVGYITINGSKAPTVDSVSICGAGTAKLGVWSKAGQTVNWYDQSAGGTLLHAGDTLSTSISSTTTFYASMSENGCESDRSAAVAVVLEAGTPSAGDQVICAPGGVVDLTASSSNGGALYWYSSASSDVTIATGATFSPTVSSDTTFYVTSAAGLAQSNVGHPDTSIGGGSDHAGGFYLIFTAEQDVVIKSATVYANGAKNRTFELRDNSGTVVDSKVVFVPNGQSRVDLNFNVSAGADWQIGAASGANLFRSNAGVSFPYVATDLISITTSTAGDLYYYYLYDITVQAAEMCESAKVPVSVTVDVCTGVSAVVLSRVSLYPNPSEGLVRIKEAEGVSLTVLTAEGKAVMTKRIQSNDEQVDITLLAEGVYSFRFTGDDGTEKVIAVTKI